MGAKEDIFGVARAFMRSRIILTAAELDLFTIIQDSSRALNKLPKDAVSTEEHSHGFLIALLRLDFSTRKEMLFANRGGRHFSSKHSAVRASNVAAHEPSLGQLERFDRNRQKRRRL